MADVVVVTGAAGGIGRAVVRRFAEAGAHVGLLARGEDGLRAAQKEVEAHGGRAVVVPMDVADADAVEAAAATVEDELGPIDIWVNNAMTTVFSPLLRMTADELKRVTEVTYLGYAYGTLTALRRMVPRDGGTIVQVGSALAYQGIPLQSAYCGAKHAIQGFTESVQAELLHDGSRVHITTVHLPGMNTPQFSWCRSHLDHEPQPVPPILQPEPAAEAIYWAAHHRRREVLLDGPTVQTVLGAHLAPWLMTRIVAKRAYEGQMTDEPTAPDRKDNLYEPLPGDPGAHGAFDDQAASGPLRLPWFVPTGLVDFGLSAVATALGFSVRLVKKSST